MQKEDKNEEKQDPITEVKSLLQKVWQTLQDNKTGTVDSSLRQDQSLPSSSLTENLSTPSSSSAKSKCSQSLSPENYQSTSSGLQSSYHGNLAKEYKTLFSPYAFTTGKKKMTKKITKPLKIISPGIKTWTHTFCVLSDKNQSKRPSAQNKHELKQAGLGEKRIKFELDCDHEGFKKELEQNYPKLKDCGGFEILRVGDRSNLTIVEIGDGYSPASLKNGCQLGQAVAYIRPIQKSLSLEPVNTRVPESTAVFEVCSRCKISVPMCLLREHLKTCGETSSLDSDSTDDSSFNDEDIVHGPSDDPIPSDRRNTENKNAVKINVGAMIDEKSNSDDDIDDVEHFTMNMDDVDRLQSMFPTKTRHDLIKELQNCSGLVTLALDHLLEDNISPDIISPNQAIEQYLSRTRKYDEVARINVDRMDEDGGIHDLLTFYKDKKKDLCAKPQIKFEGESGVGSGPMKEFFYMTMAAVSNGFVVGGDKILLFEGQDDHRLPKPDINYLEAGLFELCGRMIGHCLLWGDQFFYGLSPATICYWLWGKEEVVSRAVLKVEDIPDIELQEYIRDLLALQTNDKVPEILQDNLQEYLNEAKIYSLSGNKLIITQQLLIFNVITKREPELNSLAIGLDSVNLLAFLKSSPSASSVIFPAQNDRIFTANDIKNSLSKSAPIPKTEEETLTFSLFESYLSELEQRKGGHLASLLQFWTGTTDLPAMSQPLSIGFTTEGKFPKATVCTQKLILPLKPKTQQEFSSNFDTALNFGSTGFGVV